MQNQIRGSGQGYLKLVAHNFVLAESGTYQMQPQRHYDTRLSVQAATRIQEVMEQNGSTTISPSVLSNHAPDFMSIDNTVGQYGVQGIAIPQQWGAKRAIFILKFRAHMATGALVDYVVQGYTNHFGIGRGGAIDPNMEMFINNVSTIIPHMTNINGVMQSTGRLEKFFQPVINHAAAAKPSPTQGYLLRPRDVMVSVANSGLAQGFESVQHPSSQLRAGHLATSNKTNNIPMFYASRLLNSVSQASIMPDDPMMMTKDIDPVSAIADQALGDLGESGEQDLFLRFLGSTINGSSRATASFRYSDILRLFPNLEDHGVGSVLRSGPTTIQMSSADQSEHWTGRGLDTKIALQMASAIPALLLESMGHNTVFEISNLSGGMPHIRIRTFTPFSDGMLNASSSKFVNLLTSQLIGQITMQNSVAFNALVSVNIYGEIVIQLRVGDYPATRFVAPAFCDSLMAPILVDTVEQRDNFNNTLRRTFLDVYESARSIDGLREIAHGKNVLNQAVAPARDFSGHFQMPGFVNTGGGTIPFHQTPQQTPSHQPQRPGGYGAVSPGGVGAAAPQGRRPPGLGSLLSGN